MKLVRVSAVDTPHQGVLYDARKTKAFAWKRIKALRQRIKDEHIGGNSHGLRLELLKAQDSHQQAQSLERQALDAIEKRANELGQTTRKEKTA